MRRGPLLVISVLVNIALIGAIYALSRQHAPEAIAQASEPPQPFSNRFKTPAVVVRKQFFNWNQVESPDYRVYIERLRDIGCPEETIRDIVIADVDKLYANRRLDEVPTAEQEWWRSTPDTNLMAAANAKVQELEQERRTLLNTLLGPNWQVEDSERAGISLSGPVLGDLPPETKQSVRDILAASQKRTQAYLQTQRNNGEAADPASLARIEQQMRNDLSKILTPGQLEEFLLRFSATAQNLRSELRGFDATPDEFRSIFRLQDPLLQQLTSVDGAASPASADVVQKQLADTIKNVLGPDRYKAYELAQDPAYGDAVAVGAQYGASSNVVQALYRLNLAAKQEQDRINNDPTLTPDQKADQLKALADQEQAAGDQLLGINQQPTQTAEPSIPSTPPMPVATQVHAYSPGETIDQIAAEYGVSSSSIVNANPNLNLNALQRGTPIKIPSKQ
jgi:LysM domain